MVSHGVLNAVRARHTRSRCPNIHVQQHDSEFPVTGVLSQVVDGFFNIEAAHFGVRLPFIGVSYCWWLMIFVLAIPKIGGLERFLVRCLVDTHCREKDSRHMQHVTT